MTNHRAKHRASAGLGLINTVLVIAAGAMLAWGASALVWPTVVPKRFATVVEGEIYRAGKLTPAALASVIEKHGIKTVIDLGAFEEGSKEDLLQQRTAEAMGVTRHRFKLYGDAGGDPNHYATSLRIMTDPANQPVLVHCGAGTERTGCTIAMYRQIFQGESLDAAFAEADERGHNPEKNPKLWYTVQVFTGPVRDALETGGPVVFPDPYVTYEQWIEAGGKVGEPVVPPRPEQP